MRWVPHTYRMKCRKETRLGGGLDIGHGVWSWDGNGRDNMESVGRRRREENV